MSNSGSQGSASPATTTGGIQSGPLVTTAIALQRINADYRIWTEADNLADGRDGRGIADIDILSFNGATWDRQRTPSVFKTALCPNAGDNAVWTPAAGKKFRLMGYFIEILSNSTQAVAGKLDLLWRDAAVATGLADSAYVNSAGVATSAPPLLVSNVQLGNGYLSSAANNVLNLNLSAALAAGSLRATVWGTEE